VIRCIWSVSMMKSIVHPQFILAGNDEAILRFTRYTWGVEDIYICSTRGPPFLPSHSKMVVVDNLK
jgi:hypothetical protein